MHTRTVALTCDTQHTHTLRCPRPAYVAHLDVVEQAVHEGLFHGAAEVRDAQPRHGAAEGEREWRESTGRENEVRGGSGR